MPLDDIREVIFEERVDEREDRGIVQGSKNFFDDVEKEQIVQYRNSMRGRHGSVDVERGYRGARILTLQTVVEASQTFEDFGGVGVALTVRV